MIIIAKINFNMVEELKKTNTPEIKALNEILKISQK